MGLSPFYGDLNWTGTDFDPDRFASVMNIDSGQWQRELSSHDELFAKLVKALDRAEAHVRAEGLRG